VIQSANKYNVSDIFSIDSQIKYVIPKYQREYIWGKDQWETLLNDLEENDNGHFIGSIICINMGTDALGVIPLEVIDGQQRLTTISLLYCAIYEKLSTLSKDNPEDTDLVVEAVNLKNRLTQKSKKGELKLELSYQSNNFADYQAILAEINIYKGLPIKPSNLGNRRIYRAYNFFRDKISDLDSEKTLDLLEKINSCLLVKIEVNTHSDAFILFESLNNRGIPLSAIDLIKNKLISKLESNNICTIDDAFNSWLTLIENLPHYIVQERFLRQFYNAFRYTPTIKVDNISKATRSNLIRVYEQLIDIDPEYIFNELINKSEIYSSIVNPVDEQNPYYSLLVDLLHVGAAPSYTFLMYLFSEYQDTQLIADTLSFLIKYMTRRNLTDFPGTRDLDNIFIGLVNECEANRNNMTISVITNYLTHPSRCVSDDMFMQKLTDDIYSENVDMTRFILSKLEEEHFTKETCKNLWERDKSQKFIWTIEHILPQGKNLPSEWIDMIANGHENRAVELQEQWVNKLGNLTLTGYNSSLSNFSFDKKRDRKDKNNNYIGYKNGLYLNEMLKTMDTWTVSDIENRTNLLVNEIVKIFAF